MSQTDVDCGICMTLAAMRQKSGTWPMFCLCANCGAQASGKGGIMRILGIDPGLRHMGWGVIDVTGPRFAHVANGICHGTGEDLAQRLLTLWTGLTAVIMLHRPDAAAVEETFVNKDAHGTLKLGQARGIALLVPAQAGLAVGEYAPNAVKKAVVGVGHADKAQVAHMVRLHLSGVQLAGPDAADALAVAICHAHHLQTAGHLARAIAKAVGA
jgi:crossover junction endodeoxyribonuclease RuvC